MHPLKRLLETPFGVLFGRFLQLATFFGLLLVGWTGWFSVRAPECGLAQAMILGLQDWLFWTISAATAAVSWGPAQYFLNHGWLARRQDERANYLCSAIMAIKKGMKRRAGTDFLAAWEQLLVAAAAELRVALGYSDHMLIKTNLLLIESPNIPKSVKVVARSRAGSPINVIHPLSPEMGVTKAIEANTTAVVARIRKLDAYKHKPYDTVAATPVESRGRAYGAITADSSDHRVFIGREEVVDRILRPYAALIMLTLPNETPSVECPERYT